MCCESYLSQSVKYLLTVIRNVPLSTNCHKNPWGRFSTYPSYNNQRECKSKNPAFIRNVMNQINYIKMNGCKQASFSN